MKDFDLDRVNTSEEARQFRLRGEVFVRRDSVRPDTTIAFEDLTPEDTAQHTLTVIDDLVLGFIEDDGGAHARYRSLREREADPVTLQDLIKMSQWLIAENAGRPTGPSSGSSTGPEGGTTGTHSTDDSSLPEERG